MTFSAEKADRCERSPEPSLRMWKESVCSYTNEEQVRWSWLRALEWASWPLFMSQVVAPFLILYCPSWLVILWVIAVNIAWALLISQTVVVLSLAYWGALAVRLKWIVSAISALVLFSRSRPVAGIVALLWPVIVMILVFPKPARVRSIQGTILRRLGFLPMEEWGAAGAIKTATRAQVQEYAKLKGISSEEALSEIHNSGYRIEP